MTEADKYFLSLGERLQWTALSTTNGTHVSSRIINLSHNEKIGFFIFARADSNKITQIAKNPFVTLSITAHGDYFNDVAHCTARVSDKKEEIDAVYSDEAKKYGLSGRVDPALRLIIFTIHSVTHGTKVYEGVKIDPKSYTIDRSYEIPKIPEGPFKDKEAMEEVEKAIKANPNCHLITHNGLFLEDRIMETLSKEGLGVYQITQNFGAKLSQIEENPDVCLLFELKKENKQVSVECIVRVTRDQKLKDLAWKEEYARMKVTKESERWIILQYEIRKVIVHDPSLPHPIIYDCSPLKYDKDMIIAMKAAKSQDPNFLITVDKDGVPKTRMMERLNFHPVLGLYNLTRESEKLKQIKNNNHVALCTYNSTTFDEFEIETHAVIQQSEMIRYAVWLDHYKNYGYSGIDDDRLIIIRYVPYNAIEQNTKAIMEMSHEK